MKPYRDSELLWQSAVFCKALALYQERSPQVSRLPSSLMGMVNELQRVLQRQLKCETSQLEESALSVVNETVPSPASGRH